MANYESVTRSNYFHVKDEDAFSKFMDTVSGDDMHCWSDKDEDGNTLHAFGCDGSIYGVPNGAKDNDFDLFLSELQKHIAPEDAVILMESGHEKLRYVTGFAMSGMLYISRGKVTLENIIINNKTPDGKSCQFSNYPIEVTGRLATLTIADGTEIGPFPGNSCIIVSYDSTVNLNGGKILGDKQNTVEYGGGIFSSYSNININGGTISDNQSIRGSGIYAINDSNVSLKGGSIIHNKSGQGAGVYLSISKLFINGESCQITQNTVTTEPSPKDMRGEGGGIYLIYSEAEIESGTINENTAIATAPDEYGNVSGGLGGAISA